MPGPGSTGKAELVPRKQHWGGGGGYLVDSEANGVHVAPHSPLPPPVLLHQSHQKAAGHLIIPRVIILFQQLDLKLGVDPECGWEKEDMWMRHPAQLCCQKQRYRGKRYLGDSCSPQQCSPGAMCPQTPACATC